MSYCISTSNPEDDIWCLNNDTFKWFAQLVVDRFANDPDVVDQIEATLAINGLALDDLFAKKPSVSLRVRDAFGIIANEISNENCFLPSEVLLSSLEEQSAFKAKFIELSQLLDNWKHA